MVENYWPFHFTKIGHWWNGQNEIDIAAIDSDGNNIVLGECKYWQEPVGTTVLQDLESKASNVDWCRNHRHVWYVIFSTGGFSDKLDKLKELAVQRKNLLLFDE